MSKEGYWSPNTASVDWCETNYVYSYYVAEWWNTMSSFVIVLVSVYGILQWYQYKYENRFFWCFLLVIIVGLGSAAFHGTLLYTGQILDELPMIYGSLLFLYAIMENEIHKKYKYLPYLMIIYSLLFTISYIAMKTSFYFNFFVFTYIAIVTYLCFCSFQVLQQTKHQYGADKPEYKNLKQLFLLATFVYLGGFFICWLPEVFLCPKYLWPQLNLHAWFHITSSIGPYTWIMFATYHRLLVLQQYPTLSYSTLWLPIVKPKFYKKSY